MTTTATEAPPRLRAALGARVDGASLDLYRRAFGLLAAAAALRAEAYGWVDQLYVQPAWLFAWVPGLPRPGAGLLHLLFAVQALAGVSLARGRAPRAALGAWLLAFGWVELLDKATYLNHYVLFTLIGATLLLAPARPRDGGAPAWLLWLLRAEVGLVWTWAGLAKINPDWLLRGEPLATWLGARADLPLIGPWLAAPPTALAMSWGGLLYDLAVPWLLLARRTRALGFVLVLGFHAAVGLLFPIGVFPWLMGLSATLFFHPGWCRRGPAPALPAAPPLGRLGSGAFALAVAVLALVPARALREADPSWTERGHRFAWRVLLNEKTGFVEYLVEEPATGRRWRVSPAAELSPLQHEQLRTQPDLIRDYALHLAEVHAAEGREVVVRAEAWASLNGGPAGRLIDPGVDLTRPLAELEAAGWILDRPHG